MDASVLAVERAWSGHTTPCRPNHSFPWGRTLKSSTSGITISTDDLSSLVPSRTRSPAEYDKDSGKARSISSASTWLPATPQHPRSTSTLGFNRCRRVTELEMTPSRRTMRAVSAPLNAHHPSSRQRSVSSHFSSSRVPSSFQSNSRAKYFERLSETESVHEAEPDRSPSSTYNQDGLIERFKQEIDDLMLAIEEERLVHKETRQQLAEILSSKTSELKRQQDDEIREVDENFTNELESLQTSFNAEMEECTRAGCETADKLKQKIVTLQSAFEAYKNQLQQQLEKEFQTQMDELRKQHEALVQKESDSLRSTFEAETNMAKAELEKEHIEEMTQRKNEHKWHLEDTMNRLQNTTDLEKLRSLERQVKNMEEEVALADQRCQKATQNLERSKLETAAVELELKTYEESFEDRVQRVHEKYCDEIENLKTQIKEMQKTYLEKCEVVIDKQIELDAILLKRISDAKTTLKSSIQEHQQTIKPVARRPHSSPAKPHCRVQGSFVKPQEIKWPQDW